MSAHVYFGVFHICIIIWAFNYERPPSRKNGYFTRATKNWVSNWVLFLLIKIVGMVIGTKFSTIGDKNASHNGWSLHPVLIRVIVLTEYGCRTQRYLYDVNIKKLRNWDYYINITLKLTWQLYFTLH